MEQAQRHLCRFFSCSPLLASVHVEKEKLAVELMCESPQADPKDQSPALGRWWMQYLQGCCEAILSTLGLPVLSERSLPGTSSYSSEFESLNELGMGAGSSTEPCCCTPSLVLATVHLQSQGSSCSHLSCVFLQVYPSRHN